MRKNKRSLAILFIAALAIDVLVVSFNLCFEGKIFNEKFFSFMWFVAETIFTSVIIGFIVKMISDDLIKVKSNDYKMKKLGIYEVGEGKLNSIQANTMFGSPLMGYPYPKELRFMFVSGSVFLNVFKERIIKAIEHGCNVKILLADPEGSADFLNRMEQMIPQKGEAGGDTYAEQVVYVKNIIDSIKTETIEFFEKNNIKESDRGSIELRYYIDEWRYNIRIASYHDEKNDDEYHRVWLNYQSPVKDSIYQSLTVIGYMDASQGTKTEEESLVYAMKIGFDKLWNIYNKEK